MIFLSCVSSIVLADTATQGIVTGFTEPTPSIDGKIAIWSPRTGELIHLIIPADSLTQESIVWINAAFENGWPVEAFYNANLVLRNIVIYPDFAPQGFFRIGLGQSWNPELER